MNPLRTAWRYLRRKFERNPELVDAGELVNVMLLLCMGMVIVSLGLIHICSEHVHRPIRKRSRLFFWPTA